MIGCNHRQYPPEAPPAPRSAIPHNHRLPPLTWHHHRIAGRKMPGQLLWRLPAKESDIVHAACDRPQSRFFRAGSGNIKANTGRCGSQHPHRRQQIVSAFLFHQPANKQKWRIFRTARGASQLIEWNTDIMCDQLVRRKPCWRRRRATKSDTQR